MGYLFLLLFSLLVSFPSTLFNGWVLSKLWGWFMVPTLGLPALGVIQSVGIALVISYLTVRLPDSGDNKDKDAADMFGELVSKLFQHVFYGLIILFVGYIWSQFL